MNNEAPHTHNTHSQHTQPPSLSLPLSSPPQLLHLSKPINTMVSTKAEAEALSMEELTTELTSRGLPTEGLKVSLPPCSVVVFLWSCIFLGGEVVIALSLPPDSKPKHNNTPTALHTLHSPARTHH